MVYHDFSSLSPYFSYSNYGNLMQVGGKCPILRATWSTSSTFKDSGTFSPLRSRVYRFRKVFSKRPSTQWKVGLPFGISRLITRSPPEKRISLMPLPAISPSCRTSNNFQVFGRWSSSQYAFTTASRSSLATSHGTAWLSAAYGWIPLANRKTCIIQHDMYVYAMLYIHTYIT